MCDPKSVEISAWKLLLHNAEKTSPDMPIFDEFRNLIQKVGCWKAAGRDAIRAIWWKKMGRSLNILLTLLEPILEGEETPPQWFVTGRTTLISKAGFDGEASQMRPITCLNFACKFLTKILVSILS